MGITCTSDPLRYLSDRYGEDVGKYVVSVKAEEFVDQIAPKIAKKAREHIRKASNSLDRELNTKEQKIRNIFDRILTQTLKQSRIALQGVKKRQQKNQQQIFGLTRIQNRLTKLKSNKNQIIQQHLDHILELLQQKKTQLKQELHAKRPILPDLQELTPWLKQQAMIDAEVRYDHQIKMRQQEIQTILEGSIYFYDLQDAMRKMVGIQQANDLAKAAEAAFQRIRRNLTFSDNPKSCFA